MTIQDQELGEEDYEEVLESTQRERRLVTQPYDLSINTLVEQWTDGTLTLPEIQRQYVSAVSVDDDPTRPAAHRLGR